MNEYLQMAGLIVAALVAIAVCLGLVFLAATAARNLFDRSTYRIFGAGMERGERDALRDLERAAWWFSEDKVTTNLLLELARGGFGVNNVDRARDSWRKALVRRGTGINGHDGEAD